MICLADVGVLKLHTTSVFSTEDSVSQVFYLPGHEFAFVWVYFQVGLPEPIEDLFEIVKVGPKVSIKKDDVVQVCHTDMPV